MRFEKSKPERININIASLEELKRVSHIGAKRARWISKHRPFGSIDQLAVIDGVGKNKIEDMKNQGVAYVE